MSVAIFARIGNNARENRQAPIRKRMGTRRKRMEWHEKMAELTAYLEFARKGGDMHAEISLSATNVGNLKSALDSAGIAVAVLEAFIRGKGMYPGFRLEAGKKVSLAAIGEAALRLIQ